MNSIVSRLLKLIEAKGRAINTVGPGMRIVACDKHQRSLFVWNKQDGWKEPQRRL